MLRQNVLYKYIYVNKLADTFIMHKGLYVYQIIIHDLQIYFNIRLSKENFVNN